MTIESTHPQPESGSAPANGQGQSQGHRRRRRRRKNKPSQPGATLPVSAALLPEAAPAPQASAQVRQHRPASTHQGASQGSSQGPRPPQGRKKKKFVQKASGPAQQPGNSLSSPMQNKRKGSKPKGPREFVGPMDHRD